MTFESELFMNFETIKEEMLFNELKYSIQHADHYLDEARQMLIRYRDSGGLAGNAIHIGGELRNCFIHNELQEDKVLEILDIITGWCSADLKIWQ